MKPKDSGYFGIFLCWGFMPFLAVWYFFPIKSLFSLSNLAKKVTQFVRINGIKKSNTFGTHKFIFFEIFWQRRYKNVLIQEAKIAKILNFDAAVYRNVVQIPPILFICIKVPSFSFIIINITIAWQIWIRFYGAAKKVAILGFFAVWIYAIFDLV